MAGALLGALAVVLLFAGSAWAADSVYWVSGEDGPIVRAPLAGGAASSVPVGAPSPSGVAIDAAAGRVYWADTISKTINSANLDGSGVRELNTNGANVTFPLGLSLDARGGRVYWADVDAEGIGAPESINYANLDGSGGGTVDTTGATVAIPQGLAVYPAAGRIYWANSRVDEISYANLAGGGGGDLPIGGASVGEAAGVAIDAAAQRIYWSNFGDSDSIEFANLATGAGGRFLQGAETSDPLGVAIDLTAGRLYWGQTNPLAVRSANLGDASGIAALDVSGLDPDLPAFLPVLLKSPLSVKAPVASGGPGPRSTLTCSAEWAADAPEAQLYRAAQTVTYQWLRDGKPIAGATAPTLKADLVGGYSCRSLATNFAGSTTSASSNAVTVRASLKLKRARLNPKKGTATLTLSVDAAGAIVAGGKGVLKAKKLAARAGTYRLTVRASGKAKRKLGATGRARVKVQVAFTPLGGKALKRTKTIVLKQR
ncbi:MAG TPA: hypothetical protein VMS60_15160 [Solirubrobacterales bacterium]|nr:hypothetical protein [Solirubrobacterales bacterium]